MTVTQCPFSVKHDLRPPSCHDDISVWPCCFCQLLLSTRPKPVRTHSKTSGAVGCRRIPLRAMMSWGREIKCRRGCGPDKRTPNHVLSGLFAVGFNGDGPTTRRLQEKYSQICTRQTRCCRGVAQRQAAGDEGPMARTAPGRVE